MKLSKSYNPNACIYFNLNQDLKFGVFRRSDSWICVFEPNVSIRIIGFWIKSPLAVLQQCKKPKKFCCTFTQKSSTDPQY